MAYQDAAHDDDGRSGAPNPAFTGLADWVEGEAQTRIAHRRLVEQRWLADLAQLEGVDNSDRVAQREARQQSTAVVNLTRSKCNTFVSKLYDLLFPTDDKNRAIMPTPVPETESRRDELTEQIDRLVGTANTLDEGQDAEEAERAAEAAAGLAAEADALAQEVAELEQSLQEATQRAKLMEAEIEDNLTECGYHEECRLLLEDGVQAGTGFLKGPIGLEEQVGRRWHKEDGSEWRLQNRTSEENAGRFSFHRVSYWNMLPDTGARSFRDVESWIERHILRARDLRDLAKKPGVDVDAVRRVLEQGANSKLPEHYQYLDQIADSERLTTTGQQYYVAYEYRGPLEPEYMANVITAMMEQDADEDAEEGGGMSSSMLSDIDLDPLLSLDAVLLVCQGEVIRFGVNPLEDNASIYHVFQLERSPARLWQVGVPYIMRTQSAILNDAWRLMLDNAEWAGFPILEINSSLVKLPRPGDNVLRPGDTLERTTSGTNERGVMATPIPIHQEHFAAIIQMAMEFTDQETNVSVLASGEQGTATRTAGGMALLMNSTNVVFRRVVKHFDDGITKPGMTAAYHYQMAHNPKEAIKGDYTVKARGSEVLLVREVQAQNLLLLYQLLAQHPGMAALFHMREFVKRLLQSMMLTSDGLLKTMHELQADQAAEQEAQANAPPDPALAKLELDAQMAQMDAETRMAIAEMTRETKLMELATQRDMTLEQAAARLQAAREQLASKERTMAAEIAVDSRKPPGTSTAGGHV